MFWEKDGEEIHLAELFSEPSETPVPDGPLSDEERARIEQLSPDDIKLIDDAIMANASTQWRKVALVAAEAMEVAGNRIIGVPDLYYAERVRNLVAERKLESQGNLNAMRFSEVRLPIA